MKKAVVLFSGGLDSSTVLLIARRLGYELYPLTIEYGQRHGAEVQASLKVTEALGITSPKIVKIDLRAIGGSALTDEIEVPMRSDIESMVSGIPVTYVPARNTIFLSIALGYAEVLGANDIFCGVNAVDYSGYPDCRPEFISAFQNLAQLATKAGVEGSPINIHAPLIQLTKKQIIQIGLEEEFDYGLTHSCYHPDKNGRACGHCDSCLIRKSAFAELGRNDPALSDK